MLTIRGSFQFHCTPFFNILAKTFFFPLMLKTSHWHCNVSLGAAGDYFWWMAGERVLHAKPTHTQNGILHPCFLCLAVLKKPKAWLLGTVKRSPSISRLGAGGQKQRGEKLWERVACPSAWHQYTPTRGSSRAPVANTSQMGIWAW